MKISQKNKRRIIFFAVYVPVHSLLTLVSTLIAFLSGMKDFDLLEKGLSPPPQGIGSAVIVKLAEILSALLLFPSMLAHDSFFMGQPLPFSDWLWIFLTALLYGGIILFLWEKIRAAKKISEDN